MSVSTFSAEVEPALNPAPRCLVVDDEAQVRRAICRMVGKIGLQCAEADSGATALAHLAREGDVPLVISDVNMPGMDGVELLSEVRRRLPDTAVIMLTGVADVGTAVKCLQLGALDYVSKPVEFDELRRRVTQALEKRASLLDRRQYRERLEEQVRAQARRIREMFLVGVQTLAHALEAKDPYTRGHSRRVSRYANRTAAGLGFSPADLEEIALGGELHDIGKIGTRESVLNKPAALTPEEFEHIAEHTVLGERILAPLARESPIVLRVVRSHHERMDGRGFPDGLKGEAIPIEARIVAVVDAFDAMTTNRAYRTSKSPEQAVAELQACAGTHFDPTVVDAFLAAFPDVSVLPIRD